VGGRDPDRRDPAARQGHGAAPAPAARQGHGAAPAPAARQGRGALREPARVYHRRRLVAAGALVMLLLAIAAATGAFSGSGEKPAARAEQVPPPAAPRELPRGGRSILPGRRIVAFYGAPQSRELGALGIGTPDSAARRLARQARAYEKAGRPVLPALELIAVIANADAGADDLYRARQPDAVIRRYLRAARRHDMLLLLDLQPGRSDFFAETIRLERWLREPDVGLALDPEWRVAAPDVPGHVIGSVDAREVNATSAWLAQLVARHDLPQKLFVVHQFTDDMVDDSQLLRRRELAMVLNADGFGTRPVKVSKYHAFTRRAPSFHRGFKLFYEEDVGLMTPAQVMRLRPPPDVIVYE